HLMIASTIVPIIKCFQCSLTLAGDQHGKAHPRLDASLLQCTLRSAHCWLTNRRNIPTVINAATRTPTTSETIQFRRSIGCDPAAFCAAPSPNQKRSLSIDLFDAHHVVWQGAQQ